MSSSTKGQEIAVCDFQLIRGGFDEGMEPITTTMAWRRWPETLRLAWEVMSIGNQSEKMGLRGLTVESMGLGETSHEPTNHKSNRWERFKEVINGLLGRNQWSAIDGLHKWVGDQIQRGDGLICLISQENLELILGNVKKGVV